MKILFHTTLVLVTTNNVLGWQNGSKLLKIKLSNWDITQRTLQASFSENIQNLQIKLHSLNEASKDECQKKF